MNDRFQRGEFERNLVGRQLRHFCPIESAFQLEDIDLVALKGRGKRVILLDVDNTVTCWQSEEFSERILAWIAQAKELGFDLAFLSNTRHPNRLKRISGRLGIDIVMGRMKPSRSMYRRALVKYHATTDQAVMIGDQIMTDIFGANRAGIDAIWLRPLSKSEFFMTRVNRWIEAKVAVGLYNALKRPIDSVDDPDLVVQGNAGRAIPAKKRGLISQFIKFCVVGGVSTAIALALSVLLLKHIRLEGTLISDSLGQWLIAKFPNFYSVSSNPIKVAAPIMYGIANLVAMLNSYVWNRFWTFEIRGKEEQMAQLKKFYFVSILVWIVNSLLAAWILNRLNDNSSRNVIISQLVASAITMFLNFAGQRLYAFKPKVSS